MWFKQQKNNQKKRSQRGFTLIETFVAVTVLLIAIAGPFTLVMKALSVAKSTKGQIISMYLAQEAIEYIRNIRDENILTGNNWLTDLNGTKVKADGTTEACFPPGPDCDCLTGKCIINASVHRDVATCEIDGCPPIQFNSEVKLYGYSVDPDWEDTVFTRTIEIDEIDTNKEVIITVTMEWQEGPNEKEFVVKEHLLNWQ